MMQMPADYTDAVRDGLAYVIAHACGDEHGMAAIVEASEPGQLAAALAMFIEGVLTWQGNDPETWARSMQRQFLADSLLARSYCNYACSTP